MKVQITGLLLLLLLLPLSRSAMSQDSFTLSLSNSDFVVTPVFNNVPIFSFDIEFAGTLAPGVYDNPPVNRVEYRVEGNLANTPSGFPAFALERSLSGADFYAQGSSLRFEIAAGAVLTDGVQVAELAGSDVVFRFDGREVDNGRFHPALFELRADGTGRLQNSNNVVSVNPPQEVGFGEEYVTDLNFDAGNLTALVGPPPPSDQAPIGADGGGPLSPLLMLGLLAAAWLRRMSMRASRTPRVP